MTKHYLVVVLVFSGCAGVQAPAVAPPPARVQAPPDIVKVDTTVSTKFYSVRATTSPAIFEEIDGNGLVETSGRQNRLIDTLNWMRW